MRMNYSNSLTPSDMTHPHQTIIDGIASGRKASFRLCNARSTWKDLDSSAGLMVWQDLVMGRNHYEFKLKPKMIKIGDTEVVAPLGVVLFGEIVYCLESDGEVHQMEFDNTDTGHQDLFLAKRLFAEKHQAEAFHKALLNYINSQC